MNFKPEIGTRVALSNGVKGTVTGYPKKEKHHDKVFVLKDNRTGCNAITIAKFTNLVLL